MRRIITGVDADGRSCVVEETSLSDPDNMLSEVYATDRPIPPARQPAGGQHMDLHVAPGHTRWLVVRWAPDLEAQFHHTDSIDYDTVMDGSMTLILDDGEHELGPGDCVVMVGVGHGWRSGSAGCTMSVVVLGSEPSRPGD